MIDAPQVRSHSRSALQILPALFIAGIFLVSSDCSRIKPLVTQGDDCLRSGYEQYTYYHPTMIRDQYRDGVVIGPVRIGEMGGPLRDVILCLQISHKSTADLELALRYDVDHDGVAEASAPVDFFKGRANGCGAPAPHACTMALHGVYWFRDSELAGPECPFSVFNGLARGGSFFLAVSDTLAKDVGTIANWSVYVASTDLLTCR